MSAAIDPRDPVWCEWCGERPAPQGEPCDQCRQLGAVREQRPDPAPAHAAPVFVYLHYKKGGQPVGVWHVANDDRTLPGCRSKRLSWEVGAEVVIKESPTPPQVGRFCYICADRVRRAV